MFVFAVRVSAEPALASLRAILTSPAAPHDTIGYDLYRWDAFPSILVIDTPDFHFQDRMFSRLAFFLEKRGFRGRLLDNNALESLHGWNAHDYGPDGLASFFNAVELTGMTLNPEEIILRDIALDQGVIAMVRDNYAPGVGGILSISRSSSYYERRLLLTHESFHGIFFTSPQYREFCFQLWGSLSPRVQTFFIRFLEQLGYAADYRFLCVNEFQAYLMQQPVRYAPEYFQRVIQRFGGAETQVPVGALLEAARRLDGYLGSRFDIHAGQTVQIWRARRESE
jgi:hypothetical protein